MKKDQARVAKKYARALFDLTDKQELDVMAEALGRICAVLEERGDLMEFLRTPSINLKERVSVVSEIAKSVNSNETFTRFIGYICENGRISYLKEVLKVFMELVTQYRKLSSLEIVSAFELSDKEKGDISKKVSEDFSKYGLRPEMSWSVNKNIIGGLIVKAGDKVLDGSLSGALNRLEQSLV